MCPSIGGREEREVCYRSNYHSLCFQRLRKQVMLEHEQNMIALNDHLQMTRLRQQKRFV